MRVVADIADIADIADTHAIHAVVGQVDLDLIRTQRVQAAPIRAMREQPRVLAVASPTTPRSLVLEPQIDGKPTTNPVRHRIERDERVLAVTIQRLPEQLVLHEDHIASITTVYPLRVAQQPIDGQREERQCRRHGARIRQPVDDTLRRAQSHATAVLVQRQCRIDHGQTPLVHLVAHMIRCTRRVGNHARDRNIATHWQRRARQGRAPCRRRAPGERIITEIVVEDNLRGIQTAIKHRQTGHIAGQQLVLIGRRTDEEG